MCKLEENKFSEGDRDKNDGSFGSITLSEAINQPLFRKSKSQVMFFSSHEYRLYHSCASDENPFTHLICFGLITYQKSHKLPDIQLS